MTETLEAQPFRIHQFASQLKDLGEDSEKARDYMSEFVELESTELGLLHLVVPLDNATSYAVGSMITGIKTVLEDSAPAVEAAVEFYKTTDHDRAAKLDKTYAAAVAVPTGEGYDLDDPVQDTVPLEDGGSTTDASQGATYYIEKPSQLLNHPYPDDPIERDLIAFSYITDWLDPIEVIRKGLEWVFHYNPGEVVSEWLLGDWEAVAEAGVALRQLGEWSDAVADKVEGAHLMVGFFWKGQAADAAHSYFEQFAGTVQGAAPSLNDTSDRYRAMASGMKALSEAVADCVHFCEDKLIAIGVKAAAGALLSETVVGALIFGAWAISDAAKCVEKFNAAVETYNTTRSLIEAAAGSGAMFIASLPGVDALPLPAAYHHPGVPAPKGPR